MLIVLMGVSLIIIGVGHKLSNDCDDSGEIITAVGAISFCAICLGFAICLSSVSNRSITDDKILLYESQNKEIEQSVEVTVAEYMKYEKDTLIEIKPENVLAIAQTYPNLVSNTLVQQQITLYIENNKIIRSLKEEKLDYKLKAWWVYFGE